MLFFLFHSKKKNVYLSNGTLSVTRIHQCSVFPSALLVFHVYFENQFLFCWRYWGVRILHTCRLKPFHTTDVFTIRRRVQNSYQCRQSVKFSVCAGVSVCLQKEGILCNYHKFVFFVVSSVSRRNNIFF